MLLDAFLPHPDFSERHELAIETTTRVVYQAIWEADMAGHPIIRALLWLRALPSRALSRQWHLDGSPVTLAVVTAMGFCILAEDPGHEVVLGIIGPFWRLTGNLRPCDPASFQELLQPGLAKAAWNFAVASRKGVTMLSTETRISCADPASLRRFRLYWLFVRPWSGLIRILVLRAIAARAVTVAAAAQGE